MSAAILLGCDSGSGAGQADVETPPPPPPTSIGASNQGRSARASDGSPFWPLYIAAFPMATVRRYQNASGPDRSRQHSTRRR